MLHAKPNHSTMPSASPQPKIRHISKCLVNPPSPTPPHHHLAPYDLAMLSAQYIQKGLLFSTPLATPIDRLKSSLSAALVPFYPLAGRFVTHRSPQKGGGGGITISIEISGQGAEFIHAVADNVTIADVLAPFDDVPSDLVDQLFPCDGAANHDGHSLPLLAVQVTELADDGVFVACSFNHALGDGTSYWHFFNAWAEIARSSWKHGEPVLVSRPPVHERWFIDGVGYLPFELPFSDSDEFVFHVPRAQLRERIFHFSAESISRLKSRANEECGATGEISSFQALSSLMWRSIIRARRFPDSQETSCRLAANHRSRLRPPLSPDYFGNSMYPLKVTMTTGELLSHGLGWGAQVLNRTVAAHDDGGIREMLRKWHSSPMVYRMDMFDPFSVMMGSSPRFDMYGCDFGWGKAVALRSGSAHKFDGKVSSYPGWEGGGSVDLEVCLEPEAMSALLLDVDFMAAVSQAPNIGLVRDGSVICVFSRP